MTMQAVQPQMIFPGQRAAPRRLACRPRTEEEDGTRRLLVNVFTQALKDASSTTDTPSRGEARAWLRESGALWAQALGLRVSQIMIDSWAADGWPRRS